MRAHLHPELVNEPFGDPGLFVDFLFERRALLFDLGDLRGLPPKKILRVSDVFVSHTHMDHFFGFDWLLRIGVGRDRMVRLFGPPGFLDQVGSRLSAYTWNLVHNYVDDYVLVVTEIHPDGAARRARFRCHARFAQEAEETLAPAGLVLVDEPGIRVRAAFLDHDVPCLAFALEETAHLNIFVNRLADLGLAPGPWLKDLKAAVLAGLPGDHPVTLPDGRIMALGDLQRQVLQVVPGQKIAYVTDTAYHERNAAAIAALARDADLLFIECVFLDEDRDRAAARFHLTARQAGTLARMAGVRQVVPFHFSPRYHEREDELRAELESAFRGTP